MPAIEKLSVSFPRPWICRLICVLCVSLCIGCIDAIIDGQFLVPQIQRRSCSSKNLSFALNHSQTDPSKIPGTKIWYSRQFRQFRNPVPIGPIAKICQSHYWTSRTDWGLRCLRVHCFSCDMAGSVISLWSTPPTTAWVFKTEFLLPWRHGLYMQWIEKRWKHVICSDLVMLWYALYRLETSWTFTLYPDQNKIIHFELANHNSPGAVAAVELMVQAHSGAYHSQGRVDSGVEDIEGSIAQNTWSGMHNMWKKTVGCIAWDVCKQIHKIQPKERLEYAVSRMKLDK